ncbi:MAG TPA: hypothetical protein VK727_15760 [Steroidobacteraceae bacterium]|jgi:hypothetical protein|nr:hypothetical protein [Steroidobacteraceae bacterium]
MTVMGSGAFAQGSNSLRAITVGIPIEQVQLSRHVGYSDLDLSTAAGRAALAQAESAAAAAPKK